MPSNITLGSTLRTNLAAGDQAALLSALAGLASHWLRESGVPHSISDPPLATAAHLLSDPARGALLSAGLDLLNILSLSPQGREAVENFGRRPYRAPLPSTSTSDLHIDEIIRQLDRRLCRNPNFLKALRRFSDASPQEVAK